MNAPALVRTIPTPGQLVSVRQRRFVVSAIAAGALPPTDLAPAASHAPQHLVTLQSVEDDGLGEELQVIWELEPGAGVYERATLPDPRQGFDDPKRLDAFLDAVRWGAVASADLSQLNAPFRSGITIEDYQLDPVVRALQMPRVNLLIADDVGLGKTIEAGLVVQELLLRHRARTILVVCPAGLQIQWHDQMRDKFGLEFRIVDSELMKELRRRRGLHVNPWTHFPRLITSIDFLKRERPLRLLREVLPPEGQPAFPRKFDLLIVDEAHNVAPSGRGNYAQDSLRTEAIRLLAPHFEHKLFLSATPHNGYSESFSALLELLDDQRFHRGVPPDKAQLGAVMVRRLKSELPPDDLGKPRFPKRELEAIAVDYTEDERQVHRDLQRYTELRQKGASDAAEAFATEFVLKLLKKRLFSSPEAFRITLEKHADSVRSGKTRKPTVTRPNISVLRREVDCAEEDAADDDAFEDRNLEAVTATSTVFRPLDGEESGLIDRMLAWAKRAAGRADTKARRLIDWLNATLRPGGKWNQERVLLFTEYRATQNWLQDLLAAEGLTHNGRLQTIYGGMRTEDREATKAAFQAHPDVSEVRILLATDAASEGIDLQNHCSRLVHYEIPWNPNRMEQRNGRIDRHGQRAKRVEIFHFVGKGFERDQLVGRPPGDLEGDLEFLMRAALKVDQIREDLGNVSDVLAQNVEQAMLGRTRTLRDPVTNNRRAAEVRSMLRFERKLKEQLERLRERLRESRDELRLSPQNVQSVVQVAMELAGLPPLRPTKIPGPEGKGTLPAWHLPPLSGTWAPCAEGLTHKHTHEVRPITFDHAVAVGRDDVVLAHLNHRLVQMCLRLLRAEVWMPEGQGKLHRVSARVVPDATLEHPALIALGRLVVLGADSSRLHEEVIAAGGFLREGRFQRLNVNEAKTAIEAVRSDRAHAAPERVGQRLAELWPQHIEGVTAALRVRMEERNKGLKAKLQERAAKEIADVTLVLEELRRAILNELHTEPPKQLDWLVPEKEQLERNREALRLRVAGIPDEILRESAAIRARFENPTPRLFPVAITYVVPQRLAGG